MLNNKEIERIKNKFPNGTRIKLHYMNDEYNVPIGILGYG